jgi:hypothetical protein
MAAVSSCPGFLFRHDVQKSLRNGHTLFLPRLVFAESLLAQVRVT